MALVLRKRDSGVLSPTSSRSTLEQDLKKLDGCYCQLKVFIAQETSNGEQFLTPLRDIQKVLERVVLLSGDGGDSPSINRQVKNIYLLATEKLISYMPKINSFKQEIGTLLLDVLCYVMALERDSLAMFPSTFSSCLLYLPSPENEGASEEVMTRLCHYVLPMCLVHPYMADTLQSHLSMSTSPALMMVLEGCKQTKLHLLMADTLMQLKRDVCTDILSVIAYGTPSVRQKALNLLLHYWPLPLPEFTHHASSAYGEWSTPNCENVGCRVSTTRASVLCLDALCASKHKKGPAQFYMLLCPACDSSIHGSTSPGSHLRLQFPQPLRDVKPNCEFQKICSGKDCQVNKAEVTCYDSTCTAIQNGQPIRMCRDCHNKQHGEIRDPRHIFQVGPPYPWTSDNLARCTTMLEAVSKLLETPPTLRELQSVVRGTVPRSSTPSLPPRARYMYQLEVDTGKEGMWLLSHYCTPTGPIMPSQYGWLVHLVALVLEWLQTYYDILCGLRDRPATQGDNQECTDSGEAEFSRTISNYNDIHKLIHTYTLPWLSAVYSTNVESVSESLLPTPRGCAQVGRLWNKSHSAIERYQRALTILHRLYLLSKDQTLPMEAFMKLFSSVMPQWLDLLVQLRNEPGKMEKLQHQFQQLFTSYDTHDEGLKTYGFIWDKFRSKDSTGRQKALFWLQDLTRLQVPIPYLPHMYEEALRERRGPPQTHKPLDSTSSFDQEVVDATSSSSDLLQNVLKRKESSGSLSGYESESALVSQSSIDQPDTQMIISLNSSITRFILMLDIWLSQLEMKISTLEYCVLQKILLRMLMRKWGSTHTYQDHKDTTNMCVLCRAMALWFSLVRKLVEGYAKEGVDEGVDATDVVSPTPESRRPRVSLKLRTPILKRKKAVILGEGASEHKISQTKRGSEDSVELADTEGKTAGDGGANPMEGFPPAEPKTKPDRPRKLAQVQSYSEFEVVSQPFVSIFTPPPLPPAYKDETRDEAIPTLYKIFKLCSEKLLVRLHPDATQQIILCLTCLVRRGYVLESTDQETAAIVDVKSLFNRLWKCIESGTSHVARSCVGLLFYCIHFLATHDLHEVECTIFWKSLDNGLNSPHWSTRFRTVEKFTVMLQFMLSREAVDWDYRNFHQTTQATIAHGFCQLVRLLQDKDSNVCVRVQYCITSLKEASIEAVKHFLVKLFTDHPSHRLFILQTLSLLNSSLPEFHFLSVDLCNSLLLSISPPAVTKGEQPPQLQLPTHLGTKKISDASVLSGAMGLFPHRAVTPKGSTVSMVTAVFGPLDDDPETLALVQQVISLLLRYIGNPRSDFSKESLKRNQAQKNLPRRRTILHSRNPATDANEMLLETLKIHVCRNFHSMVTPSDLRKSGIFEVFLNHIFTVLDHNIDFGKTKGLLPFVLRLLGYSAAPIRADFPLLAMDETRAPGRELRWKNCIYTLGHLPLRLQSPWLRVFFVILYKYIHLYSEPNDYEILHLARWCLEIALNTLEADPHICHLLSTTEPKSERPALQRQTTLESSSSSVPQTPTIDSPSINIETPPTAAKLSSLIPHTPQGREPLLTPVPEEMESSGGYQSPVRVVKKQQVGVSVSLPIGRHKVSSGQREGGKKQSVTPSEAAEFVNVQKQRVGPTVSNSTVSSASESLRPPPSQVSPPRVGLCSICGKVTNEYLEEVIALCVVVVGTCSHRMPSIVSPYLISRVIPAIAKVIVPGAYLWQTCVSDPTPGSALEVAKHFIACILTQFGDRRLFLYLFGHDLGAQADIVFHAIAKSLPEHESESEGGGSGGGKEDEDEGKLYQCSPVKYFLEDTHSMQDIQRHSLINLACYMEKIPSSLPTLMRHIPLWDNFCKKLKTHSTLLRDTEAVQSFLHVIILLLDSVLSQSFLSTVHAHTMQSFMQSLLAVVEVALHSVYCPLGGLVQLAALWYKVFQQQSQRESEKFVKLYITELRNGLKVHNSGESIQPENLLALIQLLLLEEDGYLGYVDSLTDERLYAPQLKTTHETHCLTVIDSIQWDLTDCLTFLSSSNERWPPEMVPQLKLSIAQLLALRAQHQRSPLARLKGIISGNSRPTATAGTKSGTVIQPTSDDHLSSLRILAWLMLGAMCHNAVDSAAIEMRMEGNINVGGQCRLLYSFNTNMEVNTRGILKLVKGVLQRLTTANEPNFGFLYLTFMFTAIWTVYMELYEPNSAPFIVEFWQNFIVYLVQLLRSNNIEDTYCSEVVHSLKEYVVVKIKKIGLSCYTLLLPVWRESTAVVGDPMMTFPDIPSTTTIPVEKWFKEAINDMVVIEAEGEWQQPTDANTKL